MKKHVFFLLLIISGDLIAWGPTGHRSIGLIAEEHLSRKARREINKLLGDRSLAEVSVWMDDIRSDERYDHTHDWHWVTVPDGKTYEETEKNPDGDLISALKDAIAKVADNNISDSLRAEHLKMIVHLVGDFHQPLHVGTGEDAGGNRKQVFWFGRRSNLHRVWDSQLIESTQYSYTELAASLPEPDKGEIRAWQSDSFDVWVREAQYLRPEVYDIPDDNSLGYEYRYANWPVIEQQLLKGGVRLAGILNEAFK